MKTPLKLLSGKLAQRTGQPAPGYRRVYQAILDGHIPAVRVGRELMVDDADLPVAERVLGLSAPDQVAA